MSICLISALPAEARPLIAYFGLRALNHRYLRLYAGELNGKPGYLLQCGVGKLNAASATAAMLQSLPEVTAVVNVGIAGSQHPIGQTLIAHGVQDQASSQRWYPHLPPVNKIPEATSIQVVTVDKPATNYTADNAFDMEASGIFNAASKVIDLAFIHSIKVVSDNDQSNIEAITSKSVANNISRAIGTVEKLVQALPFDTLPATTDVTALTQSLTTRIHYTATEQHALIQLLHRYNALYGELPDNIFLQNHTNAKSLRNALSSMIDSAAVTY